MLNSITDSKGTTQINYDQANNRLNIIYANGRSLTYTFDSLGRRTQLITQDSTGIKTVNYSYDRFSRLDTLKDGSGNLIVDYDYDSLDRLQKETNFKLALNLTR